MDAPSPDLLWLGLTIAGAVVLAGLALRYRAVERSWSWLRATALELGAVRLVSLGIVAVGLAFLVAILNDKHGPVLMLVKALDPLVLLPTAYGWWLSRKPEYPSGWPVAVVAMGCATGVALSELVLWSSQLTREPRDAAVGAGFFLSVGLVLSGLAGFFHSAAASAEDA